MKPFHKHTLIAIYLLAIVISLLIKAIAGL